MKTRLKLNWLIVMVVALTGLLPAARAFYAPATQRWLNRDPLGEKGHMLLRGACVDCNAALLKEANIYLFCANSPVFRRDAFGLVDAEDCQAQLTKDMADVAKAGGKCATEAIGVGLVGGILSIIAGGVGAICTTPVGGVVIGGCGVGLTAIVDVCLYNHCMGPVHKMGDDAKKKYADCMKKAEGN